MQLISSNIKYHYQFEISKLYFAHLYSICISMELDRFHSPRSDKFHAARHIIEISPHDQMCFLLMAVFFIVATNNHLKRSPVVLFLSLGDDGLRAVIRNSYIFFYLSLRQSH